MKPINIGGHSAYQNRVLTQLRKYYPDTGNFLSASTWHIPDKFWNRYNKNKGIKKFFKKS